MKKPGMILFIPPISAKHKFWETSGHLGFYKENMYSPIDIDGQQYYLKPMNCPFHVHIYKSQMRSYRDLPMRFAEMGTVYRYERSGVLHGLLRVRGFTQDDAHHFCTPEQMPDEIDFVLNFCLHILRSFGFEDFKAYLGTRPEKAVGEESRWRDCGSSTERLSLDRSGLDYEIDEGGGAFYGPKIDLKVKDAIGREWQLSTNQFDFNLPDRFDLTYIGEDGQQHRPYMVHRALMGSMERFFGILIEHYGGAFPVWLAPMQAMAIPIADRHMDYAQEVVEKLKADRHPGKTGQPQRTDERQDPRRAETKNPVYAGRSATMKWNPARWPCAYVLAITPARWRWTNSSKSPNRILPIKSKFVRYYAGLRECANLLFSTSQISFMVISK